MSVYVIVKERDRYLASLKSAAEEDAREGKGTEIVESEGEFTSQSKALERARELNK